jgi:S-methylmethionine-dependent homocysteine/selenocysteine methylase
MSVNDILGGERRVMLFRFPVAGGSERVASLLGERAGAGRVVVIDGGMGSELEARGVRMDDAAWSGAANLEQPDEVRAAHEDFIRAGAEVIITNTYAAGRWPLEPAGLGDRVAEANRNAVRAAIEARERAGREVLIAGSMSRTAAVEYGGAARPVDARAVYDEQAALLADAGVDLIVLEMISAVEYGEPALAAARSTGLPVWLGLSAGRGENGRLVAWHNEDVAFDDLVRALVAPDLGAVLVMHTEIADVDDALEVVMSNWTGPVGVYPHAGDYIPPHWQFSDLTPDELVENTSRWVARGARIVGGCCGTRPAHIAALAAEFGNP